MTRKLTEDERAELLASNASRDVVEAVLARLDDLEARVAAAKGAPQRAELMAAVGGLQAGKSAGERLVAAQMRAARSGDWSEVVRLLGR